MGEEQLVVIQGAAAEEEEEESQYSFVSLDPKSTLYEMITHELENRPDWLRRPNDKSRFNLLLAKTHGADIPFERIGTEGILQAVNYFRGCGALTRKAETVKSLNSYCVTHGFAPDRFAPISFVLTTVNAAVDATKTGVAAMKAKGRAQKEASARQLFLEAFEAQRSVTGVDQNVWICKPSRGGKGDGIKLFTDSDQLIGFVDGFESGVWVAQAYIERPLLLPGSRKFDIRVWALAVESVDSPLQLFLYKEGVLRTSCVRYSLDDLSDDFVHLTNHAVQEKHEGFDTFEEGNELFFDDFEEKLKEEGHDWSFKESGWPQVKEIVHHSFMSSWEMLASTREYTSFQVFGYDFMIDEAYKVWLLEVNAAPCVTERLRPLFAEELMRVVIDSSFPRKVKVEPTNVVEPMFELVHHL